MSNGTLALSIVWYLGGLLAALGALGVVRPIRWLGVPTRGRAVRALLAGVVLGLVAFLTGTSLTRVSAPRTLLDEIVPAFQFDEVHALDIRATAARTYRAVYDVTAEEITGYRTLTWIRCLGQCAGESILNPAARTPILETALRTSFRRLAERPGDELVFGTFVAAPPGALRRTWTREAFVALEEPGFAKAAMNFRVEARGPDACVLHTATRVYATDPATLRVFAIYWRTIAPGSAIIRREWLKAIKRRAEGH